MTITQTVEILASHRLVFDVPENIPLGAADVAITITPRKETAYHTAASLKRLSGRWKNSAHFGRDALHIQREMRSEWDNRIDEAAWARLKAGTKADG